MKTLLCSWLSILLTTLCLAQPGRFWQVNLGVDRRTALLHLIDQRQAQLVSDYLGPINSLEKIIRITGAFNESDTGILEFGLVSPIYREQEDLVYAGTLRLKRESPEAYAATFYEYFRKLQTKYGPPNPNLFFNIEDSITQVTLLNKINSGKEFRLTWFDKQSGFKRELIYKPDLPEKLVLDYRMVDILAMTRYLKETADY